MGSWKKYFQHVSRDRYLTANQGRPVDNFNSPTATGGKYASYLPEVYAGQPGRIERYAQYDQMNMDSEINASLDTIADFSTQAEEHQITPFKFVFKGEVSDTEVEVLKTSLQQWVGINQFNRRIWRIFRQVLQYGDQFFIRDPETMEWLWVEHNKVQSVIVNEAEGKKPEQYIIIDLDYNQESLTATEPSMIANTNTTTATNIQRPGGKTSVSTTTTTAGGLYARPGVQGNPGQGVDAKHVIHLSLSEGLDTNWPFGNSILESIFKVFKQKELLEDSIIIYRVQRAPERRVFYIDVGSMPTHKAMTYVERIKNEIHQRRIPNRTGGGSAIMDAAYNPLAIIEDYFFAQGSDGRGSKVETLPGGDNLGQIDDLKYFDNKLKRGLRIPSSYLPGILDDPGAVFADGRVGTAYIQEYRFAKYCKRLQMLVSHIFDKEYKLFLKKREYNIDSSLFEIQFHEPQNFSKYKQMEIDTAQINIFQPLAEIKYLSKRFLLKRFLNMTEDEILENERLWKEENADAVKKATGVSPADGQSVDMGSVGVRPSGGGMGGFGGAEPDLGGGEPSPGEGAEVGGGEPGGEAGGGEAGGEGGTL